MNNFEQFVPPLELCKQIPDGAFADSHFTWCLVSPAFLEGAGYSTVRNNRWLILDTPFRKRKLPGILHQLPAPTLAEILEALGAATCYHLGETWTVSLCNDSLDNGVKDATPATAALRLWLKVEGIE